MPLIPGSVLIIALHEGGTRALAGVRWPWTFDPLTVSLVLASAIVYLRGVLALRAHGGLRDRAARWQVAAFTAGWAVAALAMLSPIAWLSTVLLSVHMTQHELLMLVAAPLLAFGRPGVAAIWSVPARWRRGTARAVRSPLMLWLWRAVTAPLAVFLLHAIVLWVWHLPLLYEWALASDAVHVVQHLMFLAAAALFWWGMFAGRYGAVGYGAAIAYVFLTAMHSSALGALMAMSGSPWYETYVAAARRWLVDPVGDQRMAGLLMWIPFGTLFMGLGLALAAAWLREAERRARVGAADALRQPRRPSA
jgi:cytochrome c oxidase assembly factor CtaG